MLGRSSSSRESLIKGEKTAASNRVFHKLMQASSSKHVWPTAANCYQTGHRKLQKVVEEFGIHPQ